MDNNEMQNYGQQPMQPAQPQYSQPQYQAPQQPQYQQAPQYQQPEQYAQQPVQQYAEQPVQQYAQQPVQQYAQQPVQQYTQPVQAVEYVQPVQYAQPPAEQLPTNRSFAKFFWLGLVTCSIYQVISLARVSAHINTIAGKYDGKKTMNYCLVFFLFSWLTFGILPLIWFTKLSNRIGAELKRRGIAYGFNARTFWLWYFLGTAFIAGPFIYYHKLLTAMNLLSANYNQYG